MLNSSEPTSVRHGWHSKNIQDRASHLLDDRANILLDDDSAFSWMMIQHFTFILARRSE